MNIKQINNVLENLKNKEMTNQEKYLNIQIFKNADETMNKILDTILSTFKFVN